MRTLFCILSLSLAVCEAAHAARHIRAEMPNIVVLMADDLGHASVGYNGGGAETPNLNAMASGDHSIVLTQSYAGGPVCSPTRGTLLTGRNHNRYCLWDVSNDSALPDSEVTVAEVLGGRGYHTALFGKWHLGQLRSGASTPGDHGFKEWWSSEPNSRWPGNVNPNCACFNEPCYLGHWADELADPNDVPCRNYHGVDASTGWVQQSYPTFIENDDSLFIAERFGNFLDGVVNSGDEKPFFVFLAFHAVHTNYVAPEKYRTTYEDLRYDEEKVDYYGAISALDEAVGKVRALLRAYNFSHNTLVWFTGDNGVRKESTGGDESSAFGLRGYKGDLYEGGIRVPGIIEWPAEIEENRVSDFPVVTSDLLPTVYDILGITTPPEMDGVSLLPLICGETDSRNTSIAWLYAKPQIIQRGRYQAALRRDWFKFVAVYNQRQAVQRAYLYDLRTDMSESHDVSGDKPELFSLMMEEFEAWQSSVFDSIDTDTSCTNIFID